MEFLLGLGLATILLIGIVAFILITVLVENELGTVATILLAIFGVTFYFAGGKEAMQELLTSVTYNPVAWILGTIGYICVGIAYSFLKWYFFLKKRKDAGYTSKPRASEYSTDLIRWISYWPFSIWWVLLDEPIKRFFKGIVSYLGSTYDAITDKVYGS